MPPPPQAAVEWSKQQELGHLRRSFNTLAEGKRAITAKGLATALQRVGYRPRADETAMMIWEVDENCDGVVDWEEYVGMYRRCMADRTGLEPHSLFNLAEFMIFDVDKDGTIDRDELMEALFTRYGMDQLLERSKGFFPAEQSSGGVFDGELRLSFVQFRDTMRAMRSNSKLARKAKRDS